MQGLNGSWSGIMPFMAFFGKGNKKCVIIHLCGMTSIPVHFRKMAGEKMFYDTVEIAAIKIAVSNVESLGIYSKDALIKSIVWLREKYESFGEIAYLKKAVWNIYAYLELGFSYEDGKEEFQKILEYLHMNVEDMFQEKKWQYRRVLLNKTNVTGILGRWNPVLHSMKISEAVADILNKVSVNMEGNYVYHCGKVLEEDAEKKLWEHTFRLSIRKDEAVLYDINKNKYYVFVWEGHTNDKNSDCR